ncbi:MAG: hypothetical protein E7058_01195 [Lentisphaerae bacterium]|nr:hypothetical protein [Lentisphaerota bacterium]
MKITCFRPAVTIAAVFSMMCHLAAETPMEFFQSFRRDMELNDSTSAAVKFQDPIKSSIRNSGKLPKEMRLAALSVEAAYEAMYIRNQDPNRAVIYAFQDLNGRKKCIRVELKLIGMSWVFDKYPFPAAGNLPEELAEHFIKFCSKADAHGIEEYVSQDLAGQLTVIPDGLLNNADFTVSASNSGADRCRVNVRRRGITGALTLKKEGYFWKITDIDNVLKQPFPEQLMPKLVAECKKLNLQYPPEPEESPDADQSGSNGEIPASESDDKAGASADIQDNDDWKKTYDTPELRKYLAPHVQFTIPRIIRLAAYSDNTDRNGSGETVFTIDVDNDTEIGKQKITFTHNGEKWVVSEIDDGSVYRKSQSPEKVAQKCFKLLILKNIDGLAKNSTEVFKEILHTDKMKDAINKIESPEDIKFTIEKSEITGDSSASVRINVENKVTDTKISVTLEMTLEKGQWKLSGLTKEASEVKSPDNQDEQVTE